jgi:hypothetical protein
MIPRIKRVIKAKIAINKGLLVAQRSESFIPSVGLVLGAWIDGTDDDINN